jgi:tetratricopeptide (TPR) repeat protein
LSGKTIAILCLGLTSIPVGASRADAVTYFNSCATFYNLGKMDEAIAACDKAIALDPNKADAYFIKGSALFGNGTIDGSGKYQVPPGAVEALNKYLALAPNGPHAPDVHAMLDSLK